MCIAYAPAFPSVVCVQEGERIGGGSHADQGHKSGHTAGERTTQGTYDFTNDVDPVLIEAQFQAFPQQPCWARPPGNASVLRGSGESITVVSLTLSRLGSTCWKEN